MSSANALILEKSGFRATTGHSPAREIVQLFVPKQRLDHANVHLLFQQMGCEAMAVMPNAALPP
jgi:hypothetical protein